MNPKTEASKRPNRLADEQSPYLLQHAHNPVDWFAWGEEAFRKAADEDKPVFLSIGYATCHWCHVMERESFEDEVVAALLNDGFISIKVDREERPDIDGVYMTVCQLMTGHGGWPLTVVMTPDKRPFFAGTYFPRHTRQGRVGMTELLPRLRGLWDDDRERVEAAADNAVAAVEESERQSVAGVEIGANGGPDGTGLDEETLREAYDELGSRFDRHRGGFGRAPKFPTPHQLLFLLRYHDRTGDARALEMVETTLRSMRQGGIFDHVGFGFHRYSTDARWLLPHFEKMLYDQALLALAYVETWLVTKDPFYRTVADEVLTYVGRDMTDPAGGFYSAEDADSEGVEGKFYVWSVDELASALDEDDLALVKRVYNVERRGNFVDEATQERTGENILHLTAPLEATAASLVELDVLDVGPERSPIEALESRLDGIREHLFQVREPRVHPLKDDKILTDWNGLMIAALARAGSAFGRDDYTRAATRAAGFIESELVDEQGRLLHRYRGGEAAISATAYDYAYLAWGLIELYEAGFDPRWLARALDWTDHLIADFWDEDAGGFFTAPASTELPVRQKETYDGATPSVNAVAWYNLLRLGRLTGRTDLEERAVRLARTFGAAIERGPSAFTMWMTALDFATGPTHEIVLVAPDPPSGNGTAGSPDETMRDPMLDTVRSRFLPRAVTLLKRGTDDAELAAVARHVEPHTPIDGRMTAYVCSNFACQAPVTDPAGLDDNLADPHRGADSSAGVDTR